MAYAPSGFIKDVESVLIARKDDMRLVRKVRRELGFCFIAAREVLEG